MTLTTTEDIVDVSTSIPQRVETAFGPVRMPLYCTPRRSPFSQGQRYIDFTETFLTVSRGKRKVGSPIELTPWQKWLMDSIFELNETGYWRYRQVLVGLPRKNGKSLIGSTIALCVLFFGTRGVEVYSAAATRDQAKIVFEEAKRQVRASKWLQSRLTVYRDRIENSATGAVYKPLAADADTAQGLGPRLCVLDEIHVWPHGIAKEFWNAFSAATGDQSETMMLGITTAGHDKENTLLGSLYKQGIETTKEDSDEDSFGMFWWELPEECDLFNEELWPVANPNIEEGLFDIDEVRRELRGNIALGTLGAFERFFMNRWVRSDGKEQFLLESAWNKSLTDDQTHIEKGKRVCVGFDGSTSEDSTGLILIDVETGFLEIGACWEKPENSEGWIVPRDEVNAEVARIFEEYEVERMWCDAAFYTTDVLTWAKKWRGKVVRIPQSNSRMVPMCAQLKIDLLSGTTFHGRDQRLRKHFLNAVVNPFGKVSKEDPKSKNKIDFLICSVLANGARNQILGRSELKPTKAARQVWLD